MIIRLVALASALTSVTEHTHHSNAHRQLYHERVRPHFDNFAKKKHLIFVNVHIRLKKNIYLHTCRPKQIRALTYLFIYFGLHILIVLVHFPG